MKRSLVIKRVVWQPAINVGGASLKLTKKAVNMALLDMNRGLENKYWFGIVAIK